MAQWIEVNRLACATFHRGRGEQEVLAAKLEADQKLSEQLANSPVLLRLRELEALQKIAAQPGNHFYIGLDGMIPPLASTTNRQPKT